MVRAYCIAPFFGSCEGRGTSLRRPPVTGNLEESVTVGVAVIDVADFFEDEDRNAAGAARISETGTVELAGNWVSNSGGSGSYWHTS